MNEKAYRIAKVLPVSFLLFIFMPLACGGREKKERAKKMNCMRKHEKYFVRKSKHTRIAIGECVQKKNHVLSMAVVSYFGRLKMCASSCLMVFFVRCLEMAISSIHARFSISFFSSLPFV